MEITDFNEALEKEQTKELAVNLANALIELSNLMELNGAKGPDLFKIKSYRKAASAIARCKGDISKMGKSDFMQLEGVGPSIADKAIEFITTGKISKIEELKKILPPPTIFQFTKLKKIGPVGAKKLWQEYGVSTIDELMKVADSGKITDVKLLEAITFYKITSERVLVDEALVTTNPIFDSLKMISSVKRISYAGSLLRKKDTVKDADILILADYENVVTIQKDFAKFADEIIIQGEAKMSIYSKKLRVDLTIVTNPKEWAGATLHGTGPREYNIKLRAIAKSKSLMLNDKGLWDSSGQQLDSGKSETEICELLGTVWCPPELRELAVLVSC
jgi:DNA polymerase (family 10)